MDDDRKIRFLVSPTLFVASLLLGALVDQSWRDCIIHFLIDREKTTEWSKIVGIIAAGGFLIFVIGYVIGTLTYVVLRLVFQTTVQIRPKHCRKSRYHEVAFSEGALEIVRTKLGVAVAPGRIDELYAGVVFDHGVIRENYEGVHRWLVRRWNAVNIAATSLCALPLSLFLGWLIGIPITPHWYVPVAIFWVFLLSSAVFAWRDTMGMLDFMAGLPDKVKQA